MSKGHVQRPSTVGEAERERRWRQTFGSHGSHAVASRAIPRHEDEWQCGWCGYINVGEVCTKCTTERPAESAPGGP